MRVLLLLLATAACATVQMREIEQLRGARRSAVGWSSEQHQELERLVAAERIVVVDGEGGILPRCGTGARYRVIGSKTELIEVSAPELGGDCAHAAAVITGFTRAAGRLASVSYGRVDWTGAAHSVEHLVARTRIEAGELEGRWLLRDLDGGLLCELPCRRYFVPHQHFRAGYVERSDAEGAAKVPWDPLAPGREVDLQLKVARPPGAWPYVPIVQMLVGFGGAAVSVGVLASGGPDRTSTSAAGAVGEAIAAPFLLGLLAVAGLAVGGTGIWWLASPPEPEPMLVRVGRRE